MKSQPRNLLTAKSLLERSLAVLQMIQDQANRVDSMKQWRTTWAYDSKRDEHKIEISEMALNRLVLHYNKTIYELTGTFLFATELKTLNEY